MIVFDFHMQLHLYAALYVFSNKKKNHTNKMAKININDSISFLLRGILTVLLVVSQMCFE